MITAIKELGELMLEVSGKDTLSTLIETIDEKRYPHMVSIVLEEDESFDFKGVELESTNAQESSKYLYRKGPARGSNFSPTALVTEIDKTYEIKILGWFSTIQKSKNLNKMEKEYFNKTLKSLEKNKKIILQMIGEKTSDLKSGFALTIKIGSQYLKEIPLFREAFLKMIYEKEEKISADNNICSVCGEKKEKIYGGASPFKFYTIDKPGFISGEFNESLSWRNFPVCRECSLALVEGKNTLKQYLSFRFYGLNYLLVPNFIFGKESRETVTPILLYDTRKKILLNQRVEDNLTTYEEDILHFLSEAKDTLTLHFLFLQAKQSAERILLLIEDVLPSRLRELFRAKKVVDEVFPETPFHLGRIRTFFAKSDENKGTNDLDKYFLEITDSIFKNKPIAYEFLVSNFMREIRKNFNNDDEKYKYKGTDAIQSTLFLSELNLITRKEVNVVETKFDSVFHKYMHQLDTNEKRAIFLLGSLTKMLLNIQWQERKSQPFLAQLKGLKMNNKDIIGLLPKVEAKLREYDRFDKGKAFVAEEISRLFMSSNKKWALTVDEINFYFVCGMNLYNEINLIVYDEKEEKSDDDLK